MSELEELIHDLRNPCYHRKGVMIESRTLERAAFELEKRWDEWNDSLTNQARHMARIYQRSTEIWMVNALILFIAAIWGWVR